MSGAEPGPPAEPPPATDPSPGGPVAASAASAAEPPPATGPSPDVPFPPPKRGMRVAVSALFVPLIPGALLVVATFFLHQHAVERQLAVMGALCESEAGRVQRELEVGLILREAAMERLAAARSEGDAAWRAEASSLTHGELQFRVVLELDSSLVLRAVVPAEARLMSALDPRDDATRAAALDVAAATPGRAAVAVSTAPLASGERQLLVCAPVVRAGQRRSWLVGVVRLRDLLDAHLARTVRRGFSAGVFEGQALLYGARTDEGGPAARHTHGAAVQRGFLLWRVEVWPAEELARQLETWGPTGVYIAGMLLAFFVAVSVYMWREERTP